MVKQTITNYFHLEKKQTIKDFIYKHVDLFYQVCTALPGHSYYKTVFIEMLSSAITEKVENRNRKLKCILHSIKKGHRQNIKHKERLLFD